VGEQHPVPISISDAISQLTFLSNRTPAGVDSESGSAFKRLADYRDGAIFVGHWAGHSEWERHSVGDEIVMIVDGATTIFVLDGETERAISLRKGEFVVVPMGMWHRFETPDGVKLLSVTPQPTDHSSERPS
jgi:mannose-6-phosphate isomerase-like protein (cupin superfamily)